MTKKNFLTKKEKTKEITPRSLEANFRKELGKVSPYMHFVEMLMLEFLHNCKKTDDKEKSDHKDYFVNFANSATKKYGHGRLHVTFSELEAEAPKFIKLSHLAFISSRADYFCEQILRFPAILKTREPYQSLKRTDTADFGKLEKAGFFVYIFNNKPDNFSEQILLEDYVKQVNFNKLNVDIIVRDCVGNEEWSIVDYYRKIRNTEFHGGLHQNDSSISVLDDNILSKIERRYKYKPNSPKELCARDVILYSQAWQRIAKNLCSKLFNVDDVKRLCDKYHHDTKKDETITKILSCEYLQSDARINELRKLTNVWLV